MSATAQIPGRPLNDQPSRDADADEPDFRVRLSWPQGVDPTPLEQEPPPASSAPEWPEEAFEDDEEQDQVAPPSPPLAPPAQFERTEPVSLGGGQVLTSSIPYGLPPNRQVMEAYDRLADRVLDRLAGLRADVDTDLTQVRSELASLRHAVEDVADRVQIRQLRSSIEELRDEMTGLHDSVLDGPDLEHLSGELASLRADVADLLDPEPVGPAHEELLATVASLRDEVRAQDTSEDLAELVASVEALRADLAERGDDALEAIDVLRQEMLGSLAATAERSSPVLAALSPFLEELGALREELQAMKRRITLRANESSPALSDGQLEWLAEAVGHYLADRADARQRP